MSGGQTPKCHICDDTGWMEHGTEKDPGPNSPSQWSACVVCSAGKANIGKPSLSERPKLNGGSNSVNDSLSKSTRQLLKDKLAQCTEEQQRTFKQMYAGLTDKRRCTPKIIVQISEADIDNVVNKMPDEHLDWCIRHTKAVLNNKKCK